MVKQHITLENSERSDLEELLKRGTLKVRKQKRIQALLFLDLGKSYTEVSDLLSVSYQTISQWANNFKVSKLSFLDDQPRSGRPIKFEGEERAKVTALACSEAPDGYSQWSLRLLADRLVELEIVSEISYSTVGLILKKRVTAP